jgi:hypothetical protein
MKTIDSVLKSLWLNRVGPWDIRVYAEFYKWVNTANPSLGFTQIGDAIDITKYLEGNKLQGIREEVEEFKSGRYGMIKASGLAQEFIERLEGIAKTQMGALLPDLLLENDRSVSYRYKYNDESVHLWQLVVKIGDAERDKWVSYDWIYGWLYDPTDPENTTPRWEGTGRVSLGRLRITAFTLLHWLDKKGSEFLGDYQNPAFKYYDEEDEANVMDFEKEENTLIGNYPLVPVVVDALHHVGVKDAHIYGKDDTSSGFPDIPPKIASTHAYSTIDYHGSYYRTGYVPESFFWRSYDNITLQIWYTGFPDTILETTHPKFYLTECDKSNGKTRTKEVDLIDINSNVPAGCVVRRMWIDLDSSPSARKIYVLVEEYEHHRYIMCRIDLGGGYDSIEGTSSLWMSKWIARGVGSPDKWHHTQCDIDFGLNRLYGATYRFTADKLEIGYWDLTFVETAPTTSEDWTICGAGTNACIGGGTIYGDGAGYLGGFRCVRRPGTNYHGIVGFLMGKTNTGLYVYAYDEQKDESRNVPYEDNTADCFDNEWERYQFFGEHGSIGGFFDTHGIEDYYFFPLTSWKDRQRYWFYWRCNTAIHGIIEPSQENPSPAGRAYRTFSSHGSNNLAHCTGWQFNASTAEYGGRARYDMNERTWSDGYEKDYKIQLWPTKFYAEPESRLVAAATGSAFANEWEYPLVGAPSVTQDTVLRLDADGDSIQDRSFVYYKNYKSLSEKAKLIEEGMSEEDADNAAKHRKGFLVIHSKTWLPNFSKDFISDGGSLKNEFADICFAFGLIGRFSLWGTYIFLRTESVEPIMVLTPNWKRYKEEIIEGVNRVKVEYPGGTTIYPTTNESREMLTVQSDYILEDRASKFASDLYGIHKVRHTQYKIETSHLAILEPGVDIVQLCLPIPPGEVGFTDGETKLYEYEAGQIGKHIQELVLGRVMKVEQKGVKTILTVISL